MDRLSSNYLLNLSSSRGDARDDMDRLGSHNLLDFGGSSSNARNHMHRLSSNNLLDLSSSNARDHVHSLRSKLDFGHDNVGENGRGLDDLLNRGCSSCNAFGSSDTGDNLNGLGLHNLLNGGCGLGDTGDHLDGLSSGEVGHLSLDDCRWNDHLGGDNGL